MSLGLYVTLKSWSVKPEERTGLADQNVKGLAHRTKSGTKKGKNGLNIPKIFPKILFDFLSSDQDSTNFPPSCLVTMISKTDFRVETPSLELPGLCPKVMALHIGDLAIYPKDWNYKVWRLHTSMSPFSPQHSVEEMKSTGNQNFKRQCLYLTKLFLLYFKGSIHTCSESWNFRSERDPRICTIVQSPQFTENRNKNSHLVIGKVRQEPKPNSQLNMSMRPREHLLQL